MFEYRNRLRAALAARGADAKVIESALLDLEDYHDSELVGEFGEPENYAKALLPETKSGPKFGLIILGLVFAVIIAIGLPLLDAANVPGARPLAVWAPVLALAAIGLGIIAEFFRYLSRKGS